VEKEHLPVGHFKNDLRSDQDHRLKIILRSYQDHRSFFAPKVPFLRVIFDKLKKKLF
jgi:hypothetical protein